MLKYDVMIKSLIKPHKTTEPTGPNRESLHRMITTYLLVPTLKKRTLSVVIRKRLGQIKILE